MVRYAEGGWRGDAAFSAWAGPGGPWALAQFHLVRLVDSVVALHEPLARYAGVPPPFALFAMLLVGVALSTAALLTGAVWLSPARRRPAVAVPLRPHAD